MLSHQFLGHTDHDLLLIRELLAGSDQRDHDLREHLFAFLRQLDNSLEYGGGLHFDDLWVGDAQPASPVAQHRVEFRKRLDALQQAFQLLDFFRVGVR